MPYDISIGQAALYNQMYDENGRMIAPETLAKQIDLYFLTPHPDREAYARRILAVNPDVKFIAYVLFNSADISTDMVYQNQPYALGEARELQKRYPDITMLDSNRQPIRKGTARALWLMNFAHKEHRRVLRTWMEKVLQRAKTNDGKPIFTYIGFDDYSTRAYNFQASDPEYTSLNYGPSRSSDYWNAFKENVRFNRSWVEELGVGHAANMNSPMDSAMINRFIEIMPDMAAPMNGKKSIIMLEYFMTDWNGNNHKQNAQTSLTRAKAIKDAGGDILATIRLNPFEVTRQRASKGPLYRQFMYNLHGLLLVADGHDYVRVAKSYNDFADLPEIRNEVKKFGNAVDKSYTASNGIYTRRFEKGTLTVDTNKHESYFKEEVIVVEPEPDKPIREGLTLLSGARYVNLRIDAKSDALKLGEVWSGMKVKQFRELIIEGGLTWTKLEVLNNGHWIKGYAAVFGEDEKGGWFLTIVPDIRET